MTRPVFLSIRMFICIAAAGITLYAHVQKQNELTELKLLIPTLSKQVRIMQTENTRLQYEVDRFESPIHLLELSRKPEYSHLKFPCMDDVIILDPKAVQK